MLTAVVIALALQQSAGTASWRMTFPWMTGAQTREPEMAATPPLPDWALADPFAWERSQCSPSVRRDASLEACQTRVRTQLSANLRAALPPTLAPGTVARPQRALSDRQLPEPVETVCQTSPIQTPEGQLGYGEACNEPSPLNGVGTAYRLAGG